ncbi:MAG: Serine/threonine exchanger SteT [Turneriella sp.]|nr:Serine/threonine exchanger SteT [Turneriella sp.]
MPKRQSIGLFASISIVAGCMIGTGIFLKPATMAAQAGSIGIVLLAWLVAGLLSYAGALTYAELCAHFPAAGGEYAIIRESYGRFPAYMYGWMRFTIGAPGSAASYAVGAATFLHAVIPYETLGIRIWQMAVFFILFFTIINSLTLFVSTSIQVSLTITKVLSIVVIVLLLFFFTPATPIPAPPTHWPGMASFAAVLMAAFWAYDGWNNLPMLGGEVKNPQRNLPLGLALGILIVLAIYLVLNLSFFRVLSFGEILTANSGNNSLAEPVATLALAKSIPGASVKIIAALLTISALGAMSGSILASARVPYAMATDGVFFSALGKLSSKNGIPVSATLTQGAIAALLAMSGSFDQLTDSVVFASWIFYALTTAAIFKLRRTLKSDTLPRFKVPLYPILPTVFLLCATAFILYAIIATPYLTMLGLGVIALGIPLYFLFWK